MDNGKRHIDQLFKEGLDNRSFEIPASFENDLNQRLNALEKKKKRGVFFWLITLVCIVDFSVIALLLFNTTQSPIYSSTDQTVGQMSSAPIFIDSIDTNAPHKVEAADKQDPKELALLNSSNPDGKVSSSKTTKQISSISELK